MLYATDLVFFLCVVHVQCTYCHAMYTCTCVCAYSQASLRYRELNDALETVQEKLRDARVGGTVGLLTMHGKFVLLCFTCMHVCYGVY